MCEGGWRGDEEKGGVHGIEENVDAFAVLQLTAGQRTNSDQIFHLSARIRNERNTCLPKRSGK